MVKVIPSALRGDLQLRAKYRDRARMLVDRDVVVDHTTGLRWVQAHAPELDMRHCPRLRPK
jgi:transposase-like protein